MSLSDEDVREILRIIDESSLQELRIETEGFSLHVSRNPNNPHLAHRNPAHPPAVAPEKPANGLITITSPMLGTFYRAEGPGREPFVKVGTRVDPETTVCIIEVMKMMNSIPAGVSGTVVEVCSDNAQLVEYGQPLFKVSST
jgi:acetyl-CoA carboxylase biotin carboxyl carrier protein